MTFRTLIVKRMKSSWVLMSAVFIGILIATTLAAAAPIYPISLERLGLNLLLETLTRQESNINVLVFNLHPTRERLQKVEQELSQAISDQIAPIYTTRQRYLMTDTYLAELPRRPPGFFSELTPQSFSAYYRTLSGITKHVTFESGRMATDRIRREASLTEIEAIISTNTARLFDLGIGDTILTSSDTKDPPTISVDIVGIITPTDPKEDYWAIHPSLFLDPEPFSTLTPSVDGPEREMFPSVPLFITQEGMLDGLGTAYPTSLINSIWIIRVNKEGFKRWTAGEARTRLDQFEKQLVNLIPGSEVSTTLNGTFRKFQHRTFFGKIPLLLMLTIVFITILIYLGIISSYLVQDRSADIALLITRGIGPLHIISLSIWEPLLMTLLVIIVAPFGAMALVMLSGILPYLRDMTNGTFLSADLSPMALIATLVSGILTIAVTASLGLLNTGSGLQAYKLQVGRPTNTLFFQRYYLDIALISIGGVVLWELHSQGHLVSRSLLNGFDLNESLLITPVLFLLAIALIFIRLFPILIQFVSGESLLLLNFFATLILSSASATLLITGINGDRVAWGIPLVLVISIWAIYLGTIKTRRNHYLIVGLLIQAGLVYGILLAEPLDSKDLFYLPTLGLIGLVPAQLATRLIPFLINLTPIWLLMGLRQMARNPFQYTGLILMIILATGIGVLATTIGATLERNQEDRIRYQVGADIRVTDLPPTAGRGIYPMKSRYDELPGVQKTTLALREDSRAAGVSIQLLAIESRDFSNMSWYRQDFSGIQFNNLMNILSSHRQIERVVIPDSASTIGLWAKIQELIPGLIVWALVEDGLGSIKSIPLGTPSNDDWTLLSGDLPPSMQGPIHLVSIQISEPGSGTDKTPGQLLIDNIHTKTGSSDKIMLLEDFEGQLRWFPIVTAQLSPERITTTRQESQSGRQSGVFTFTKENHYGIRGFYQSPTGGPVPIVVSNSFAKETFSSKVDIILANISNRFVPMVIREIIDYFPTMDPIGGRFVLADLNSLLGHLNIMVHTPISVPNELFIKEAPAAQQAMKIALDSMFKYWGNVQHRESLLTSSRLNPMTTAGWNSMVVLVIATVISTVGFGYTTFLVASAKKIHAQLGILLSVGLSGRQLIKLVCFEHFTIVATGMAIGTLTGLQMSQLVVSLVSFTETGQEALPPFVLITNWSLMAPIYSALITMFLVTTFILIRKSSRIDRGMLKAELG